jgi:hypothetical protein
VLLVQMTSECPAVIASASQSRHPNALPATTRAAHVLDESTRSVTRVKRKKKEIG